LSRILRVVYFLKMNDQSINSLLYLIYICHPHIPVDIQTQYDLHITDRPTVYMYVTDIKFTVEYLTVLVDTTCLFPKAEIAP
jgi:hypothetical protein